MGLGLGFGVVLIILGLVLATGTLTADVGFVDNSALGWIVLLGGIMSIVLTMVMLNQRQGSTHVEAARIQRT